MYSFCRPPDNWVSDDKSGIILLEIQRINICALSGETVDNAVSVRRLNKPFSRVAT